MVNYNTDYFTTGGGWVSKAKIWINDNKFTAILIACFIIVWLIILFAPPSVLNAINILMGARRSGVSGQLSNYAAKQGSK